MDQARINNLLFSDDTTDASPRVGGSPIVAGIPAQPENEESPAPAIHQTGMNFSAPMNTMQAPGNHLASIPQQLPPPTHLLQGHGGGYQPAPNPTISIPGPQFSVPQVPQQHSQVPQQHSQVPQQHSQVPQQHSQVPQQHSQVPQQHSQVPQQHSQVLQQHSQVPQQHPPVPPSTTPAPAPTSSSSDPARSSSAPQGQRTGNSLLVDAVAKKKITQDEAILLQKTLAEAKRRAALDPAVRPKDFVTATLRAKLGDDRARAVISAVAVQTPRPGSQPARPAPKSAAPSAAPPPAPPDGSGYGNGQSKSPPPTAVKEKTTQRLAGGDEKTKPRGEAAPKPPRKRGPKAGDESGGGRRRGSKAAAAAAASEAKQAAEVAPKENFGLDPVSIDEYQMGGRPGGHSKRNDTASSLLESVVPSDLAVTEEQQARAERRDIAGGSGLRNGAGLLRGGLYSSANNHGTSSWDNDAVMTRAKILSISEQILGMADPAISIDEDAVKYIAFAAQNILSDLVEGSIISSRRRRNQTAVQQFDKIQQLMLLPGHEKGVAIPEHGHNLGMAWYDDIEKRTLTDGLEFVQTYDSRFAELKEQVKNDLIRYDEERKLTGKKRQLAGAAGTAEQEDPWWVKDEDAEKAGLLSWSELAMAQLRLSVAKEFNLGPSRQRRAATKNKAEEAAAAEAGSSMEISTEQASSEAQSTAASSTAAQNAEWTPMRCPLFSEEGDIVTTADVLRNLSKRSKTRCAGGYFSEQVGNAVYRAKLGLPALQNQE